MRSQHPPQRRLLLLAGAFALAVAALAPYVSMLARRLGIEGLWAYWAVAWRSRFDAAVWNIAAFLLFLILVPLRKRVQWSSAGLYTGFILALFAEMFGFPLTIFLLSPFVPSPLAHRNLSMYLLGFLGMDLAMMLSMGFGTLITGVGIVMVISGWKRIYSSNGKLVTDGIYVHIRHPQYGGFILITLGWLIHWATLLTLLLWPILILLYYRLARREEKELEGMFPTEYALYKARTFMFLPYL